MHLRSLKKDLIKIYTPDHPMHSKIMHGDTYIQIDDQSDDDNINEFCNVFVTFKPQNSFKIELLGNLPITQEMADLAEIYHGNVGRQNQYLFFTITIEQLDVVANFINLIKKTTRLGNQVDNLNWVTISVRTTCSLNRFQRIVRSHLSL